MYATEVPPSFEDAVADTASVSVTALTAPAAALRKVQCRATMISVADRLQVLL
jgi:hypothetical protein